MFWCDLYKSLFLCVYGVFNIHDLDHTRLSSHKLLFGQIRTFPQDHLSSEIKPNKIVQRIRPWPYKIVQVYLYDTETVHCTVHRQCTGFFGSKGFWDSRQFRAKIVTILNIWSFDTILLSPVESKDNLFTWNSSGALLSLTFPFPSKVLCINVCPCPKCQ